MAKSNAKRARNNFVRGVRSEAALRAYTIALGYITTRDRDQAIRLLDDRIAHERAEQRDVNQRRQKPTLTEELGLQQEKQQ